MKPGDSVTKPATPPQSRAQEAGTDARRAPGLRPVGAVLQRISRRALGRRGFAEAALVTEWASIVGAALAAESQPDRISFPTGTRRDGTLTLRVAGGAATELQHLGPQLVERINGHFGYRAVARLRFVQAPLAAAPDRRPVTPPSARSAPAGEPACPQPEDLAAVESPELRAALARLGAAVIARTRGAE